MSWRCVSTDRFTGNNWFHADTRQRCHWLTWLHTWGAQTSCKKVGCFILFFYRFCGFYLSFVRLIIGYQTDNSEWVSEWEWFYTKFATGWPSVYWNKSKKMSAFINWTRLTVLPPGQLRWAGTRSVKNIPFTHCRHFHHHYEIVHLLTVSSIFTVQCIRCMQMQTLLINHCQQLFFQVFLGLHLDRGPFTS